MTEWPVQVRQHRPGGQCLSQMIQFGHVVLRPAERVLLVDSAPVALGARAFDVLLALVERRERVVSKNELLDLAWPGLVVEENNLSVQISALRKVLGQGAIATVTGRGYRLTLPGTGDAVAAVAPAPAERIVRRLAAIVVGDVVGWARLVARDAVAAVQAWKSARLELLEPTIARSGGRLIELTPERVLIEFGSAVDALAWSLDLQARLRSQREAEPAGALRMRIGLAVDDVIVDDGKLVGEGVHMAAGLHQLAGHDEVLVSDRVRDLCHRHVPVDFSAMGERLLRQMPLPMQVFAVTARAAERLDADATGIARTGDRPEQPHRQWERRPSVAVLPLLPDDPEADAYFSDGVTGEIIDALSANRSLFVIAHNSTLRFQGRHLDVADVAAELDVRYVLTGRVRRAGAALRIDVALFRPPTPAAIWHARFDGNDADVFAFQEAIARDVAGAIDPQVEQAEIDRLGGRPPTGHVDAYDCVLRALVGLYEFGQPGFDVAGEHLRQAIVLDPAYAQAHAYLSMWHNFRVGEGRSLEASEDARLAYDLAMRAVQLDPRDALVLSTAGHVLSFLKQRFDEALELFDQALALNPSCALAWARSATTLAYLGRGEEALERVRNASRLSPFDRHAFTYHTTSGTAAFVCGRYDEAVGWLGKARRGNPQYRAALRLMVAAQCLAGDLAEARALAQELLEADPGFSVAAFGAWYPLQPPHLPRMLDALRRAGLPD